MCVPSLCWRLLRHQPSSQGAQLTGLSGLVRRWRRCGWTCSARPFLSLEPVPWLQVQTNERLESASSLTEGRAVMLQLLSRKTDDTNASVLRMVKSIRRISPTKIEGLQSPSSTMRPLSVLLCNFLPTMQDSAIHCRTQCCACTPLHTGATRSRIRSYIQRKKSRHC